MNEYTLRNLLREYEKKRISAELDLENRKSVLYKNNPKLEEIENSLNTYALKIAKSIIISNDSSKYLLDLKSKIEKLNNEKKIILDSLNIDESFFKPKYECSLCNDTGYMSNGANTVLCNCIKQKLFDIEYNKSNISNLKNNNFSFFDTSLYSTSVNEDLYNSNISPQENILNIKKICINFIENFDNSSEKNLLFTGNTGLGKTFLSNCIANSLVKKGKTVLYQTAPVMLDTIIDYRFGKANISKDVYDNILDVDLLIIDDLGTECINAMKFTELFNIINTRILNQNNHITKTIISTNLSLQNLKDTYDDRIFSRFVGHYNICRFFGEDIRFKK